DAQQQMLKADVIVFEVMSFVFGEFQDAPAVFAQGQVDGNGDLCPRGPLCSDLLAKRIARGRRSAHTVQNGSIGVHNSQQQMLGFDGWAAQLGSFIPREENCPPCNFGVSLKHRWKHIANSWGLQVLRYCSSMLRRTFLQTIPIALAASPATEVP